MKGLGLIGNLFNGPDMWRRMVARGARVRVIEERLLTDGMGEVEFVVFNGPGGFEEVSCHLKKYKSVVLCDIAFNRSESEELGSPGFDPIKSLLNFGHGLAGTKERLGAPVGFLTMSTAKEEGKRWMAKVLGWKEWEDIYCLHFSPITSNGREALKQAFDFLK